MIETRSIHDPAVSGYESWVKPILEIAPLIFPGYAEAMALIGQKREALRAADIVGPTGQTAGWSPTRNFKIALEMPEAAALLFKAAFGRDALTNPRKRRFIMRMHPEFTYQLRR
jgi:hypothetical protein